MQNENDLLQKLMVSKKIMDIHNKVPRGQARDEQFQNPELQEFTAPTANYNIPKEFMSESTPTAQMNKPVATQDKIMSSKLPDEIKRLMIEHPIHQPNTMGNGSSTISNEIIEKASRLMNNDIANNVSPYQQKKPVQEMKSQNVTPNLDKNVLKNIIRETIEEVLSENGLLVESVTKSNDVFQFRVGSHIFEGKVTRIKKVK